MIATEKSSVTSIANGYTAVHVAAHAQAEAAMISAGSEVAVERVHEVDVLVQLRANLNQLDDLHGRLKHLMGELTYLLKKS